MLRLVYGKTQPGKRLPPKLFGIEIPFGHGALLNLQRVGSVAAGCGTPGRGAWPKDPLTALRLPPKLTKDIEAWAGDQEDEPNRSEAICRLVEIGLRAKRG